VEFEGVTVANLSTTKSKYVALTKVIKEAIWLKGFVSDLGITFEDAVCNTPKIWIADVLSNGLDTQGPIRPSMAH
jgi:hypothetical protein